MLGHAAELLSERVSFSTGRSRGNGPLLRRGLARLVGTVFRGASRADERSYVSDASGIRPATAVESIVQSGAQPGWHARAAWLAAPLLPRDYPASVHPSYLTYASWATVHGTMGSAAGTLSIQALLVSAGVGAVEATPAAAALNWCLKDGAGQLATIASAYAVSHQFDTHPKQWRLAAGWLENGARLLEMCTLVAPLLFLPLASASAVGKAVACLAASASKAALHLSLSKEKTNVADMTAKAGAQAVVAQLLGTSLGLFLTVSVILPRPELAPAIVLALGAVHMGALVQALRSVTLTVVDATKADALSASYIAGRPMPTPDCLSGLDDGLFPPVTIVGAQAVPTLTFGGPLHLLAADARALDELIEGASARGYVLAPGFAPTSDGNASDERGRPRRPTTRARALLLDGAPSQIALVAHLHASRLALTLDLGGDGASASAEASAYAAAHGSAYLEALAAAGWQVAMPPLDTGERLALAATAGSDAPSRENSDTSDR
ncbi:vitamin B6 photo-protection and homoeostasis-domain-containing protein [Pavlovales sp. CCMP2436]|nr:vitamin B6 photo-protection and homoeostasis-domain-containing protein [Pavlovales sp. CCMP2436]